MPRRRIGWIVGALVVALGLAAAGATFAGAQGDDTRRGTDPLSADEAQAAIDDSGAPASGATESLATNGLPDRLVLLTERHIEDKDADVNLRRADVYEYDYETDELTTSVVDLATGHVDETVTDQGTQLPLVDVEAARALELLFADDEFAGRLADEYQLATGQPLGDPEADLEIEPIVFRADAMPTVAQGAAANCGIARCAQFLIQTTGHVLINLFPLVDLSAAAVLTADGVAGA